MARARSSVPFEISFSVRFHHVHDAYGRQGIPRHIIYRGEMREARRQYVSEQAATAYDQTLKKPIVIKYDAAPGSPAGEYFYKTDAIRNTVVGAVKASP